MARRSTASVTLRWVAGAVRRRDVAMGAAGVGGGAGLLGAFGFGVLWGEAKLARRRAKLPDTGPPLADGAYAGQADGPPLRLALLGDSLAAGLGAPRAGETAGALLAGALAAEGPTVLLDVLAVSGSRSADLEPQVSRALLHPPHVAVVSIGANDVTHRIPVPVAVRELGAAVERLRDSGVLVVVGTCPDLGAVPVIGQPLRWLGRLRSRELAREQAAAVVRAGGVPVELGALLGPAFEADPALFCPDRFHPSAQGYALLADCLLPAVRAAAAAALGLPASADLSAAGTSPVGAAGTPAAAAAAGAAAAEDRAAERAAEILGDGPVTDGDDHPDPRAFA